MLIATKILQEKLISRSILALFYTGGHYTLVTDASKILVGYVLLQEQLDTADRPAGY